VAGTTSAFRASVITGAFGATSFEFATRFSDTIRFDSPDLAAAAPELASPSSSPWSRASQVLPTVSSTAYDIYAASDAPSDSATDCDCDSASDSACDSPSYSSSDSPSYATPSTYTYTDGNKLDKLDGKDGTRVSEVDGREPSGNTCIATEAG